METFDTAYRLEKYYGINGLALILVSDEVKALGKLSFRFSKVDNKEPKTQTLMEFRCIPIPRTNLFAIFSRPITEQQIEQNFNRFCVLKDDDSDK